MVGEVLVDAQIEVERARLEDDAETPERLAGRAADVMAENADRPVPGVVEMADQREQRRLARAVEAEQDGEGRRGDREGDIAQRLLGAIGMADRGNVERRDAISRSGRSHMLHW